MVVKSEANSGLRIPFLHPPDDHLAIVLTAEADVLHDLPDLSEKGAPRPDRSFIWRPPADFRTIPGNYARQPAIGVNL